MQQIDTFSFTHVGMEAHACFDADISGMLCELPYPSSWSAGMHVESGRQCGAWRMNKQISEEPQCVS